MAKICSPGTMLNGYTVIEKINNGMMAIAYAAKSSSGEKVFLKQYKSPSVTVSWYKNYVKYQQELKRRVEGSRFGHYSYRMIDFFEANNGTPAFTRCSSL